MKLYERIKNGEEKLSLVGLGYVGMPIAVAFAKKGIKVIGYDLNEAKIELYKSGVDPTKEVGDEAIKATTVQFTSDEKDLRKAKFHIEPVVVDPWASERDAMHEYGVKLTKLSDVKNADCVIVAVAHNEFKALSLDDIKKLYKTCNDGEKVLIDVKGIYKVADLKASGMSYWRL